MTLLSQYCDNTSFVNLSLVSKSNRATFLNEKTRNKMRKENSMDKFSTLALGALLTAAIGIVAAPAFAEPPEHRHDIRHDRRDIRHDRWDIRGDRRDIHNDRVDLHKDYQALKQDRGILRNDVKNGASADQIVKDRQAIRGQVTDIRSDRRDVFNDRKDGVRDRRDLRQDRRDLREDFRDKD